MFLAGLLLNLIGVILIFIGARQYKDLPIGKQTSKRDTGYLTIFYPCFLHSGLILIIVGIVLQMIGTAIKI